MPMSRSWSRTWPCVWMQGGSTIRATSASRQGQLHRALKVARPPSAVATFRMMVHPLSMASLQSTLLHCVAFQSDALSAFQWSDMEADAM